MVTLSKCINNHSIRDNSTSGGITKYPDVFLFHVEYFLDFFERHSDCLIGSTNYPSIFDCFDDQSEHMYSWYCDRCKCLAIFIESTLQRYDYRRIERDEIEGILTRQDTELKRNLAEAKRIRFEQVTIEDMINARSILDFDADLSKLENLIDIENWDHYVAVRKTTRSGRVKTPYQDFVDFCRDRNPIDIVKNFSFDYQYRLSPDKMIAYAMIGSTIDHGFIQVRKV